MVLQEVHLWTLSKVLRLPLRQQSQAEVVVYPEAVAALGRPDVQVLVVSVRHDDLVARCLVDLRGRDGVVRVRLQRAIHLAGKVALHWVCIVVHQHGVLGLQQRLHLQEARYGGVARTHRDLGEVVEEPLARTSCSDVPAAADGRVGVEDMHGRREHLGQMGQQLLGLGTRVLHCHHKAHRFGKLSIRTRGVGRCYGLRNAREGSVAEEPPHAR
mmetsp:Transcript_67765/g.163835  ORF Transcript_67765/g.163835 Transcript_67765/m.163835 type:complete len:214 (-) Transcript_67765:173-814(-)